MIFINCMKTKRKSGTTCSSSSAAAISSTSLLSLLLLLFSLSERTDAWRCSRCERELVQQTPPTFFSITSMDNTPDGDPVSDCRGCLKDKENCEEWLEFRFQIDDKFIPFSLTLPFFEFCEWRNEKGKDLKGNGDTNDDAVEHFLDCADWDQYDEDNGTNFIDQVNERGEDFPFHCFSCDQQCTKVYECGETTYACNHLFDIAVIQFNAASDSTCNSIVPFDSKFVYCSVPSGQKFTDDCLGLCGLETDEDIVAHTCPNDQKITAFWTICNDDDMVGGFGRRIGQDEFFDNDGELTETGLKISANTDLLNIDFYNIAADGGGHISCVDFGQVSCGSRTEPGVTEPMSQSSTDSTPKKAKKGKKGGKKEGKKKKNNGDDEEPEPCRRNLRPKKKGKRPSSSSEEEEDASSRAC